jgi:2-octaprenylphenol hydroxylase
MSAMMELFKQLFGHQLPLLKLMRGMGMNALDKFGSAKDHLVMLAMGLGDDMPKLARREQE